MLSFGGAVVDKGHADADGYALPAVLPASDLADLETKFYSNVINLNLRAPISGARIPTPGTEGGCRFRLDIAFGHFPQTMDDQNSARHELQ